MWPNTGQPGGDSALHTHQGAADDRLRCWLAGGLCPSPGLIILVGSLPSRMAKGSEDRGPFLAEGATCGRETQAQAFMGHQEEGTPSEGLWELRSVPSLVQSLWVANPVHSSEATLPGVVGCSPFCGGGAGRR